MAKRSTAKRGTAAKKKKAPARSRRR
jgi:hypothetical protein